MEAPDRQRGDDRRTLRWADDAHAIGLVLIRRELGGEFVVADPGRRSQSCRLADAGADLGGDRGRRTETAGIVGDVEVRLVERQRLGEVRVVGEDRAWLGERLGNAEQRRCLNEVKRLARAAEHLVEATPDFGPESQC